MDGPYRATKLWNEMLHTFRHGMPLRRHRRHMKIYEDCFSGVEAVSWLQVALKSNPNIEPGITKSQVRQLLNKFMMAGVFAIVGGTNLGENVEFKENEIYGFTSDTSGFNLPLMQNLCREPVKYGKNKDDIHKVTSVMNAGPTSCQQLLKNQGSRHHDIPKSSVFNYITDSSVERKRDVSNKTDFLYKCSDDVDNLCNKRVMGLANVPVPLPEKVFCADDRKERLPSIESVMKCPDQNRYGSSQGISLEEVNYQHEQSEFPAIQKHMVKYPQKHGHENEFPVKITSQVFACSLAQPCRSEALNPCFQDRQSSARPPLGVVNHYCTEYKEDPIINVKYDISNTCNQSKFQCAPDSFNKESKPNPHQSSSHEPLHKPISSVHERRDINDFNFYPNYGREELSDPSHYFLHSDVNKCSANRQIPVNTCVTDKDHKLWNGNIATEDVCEKIPLSKQSPLLEDVWRKIFLWRLELLLVGMEELTALLPYALPVEWLLENMTCYGHHSNSSDLDTGFQESIDNIQDEFTDIREPLITSNLYNIVTQSYLYIERLSCRNCQSNSCQRMPASQSVENLILGMASPCPPKPERQISSGNDNQIISDNILKNTVLPPNLCFETAFTSDSPVTRIVPQRAVDTLHLSRRAPISRSSRSLKFNRSHSPENGQNHSKNGCPQVDKLRRNASFLGVPTNALQKNHNVQGMKVQPNIIKSKEKSSSRGMRRPWRVTKKKAEPDQVVYSSQHCRNKSGGYVNPALSSSFDDISSHELASHELDYNAALEMLQALMQHTHVASGTEKEPSLLGSNCDLSSENDSYYTASSTPDQRRISDTSLSREPVWDEWTQPALGLGISIFQLLLLLVSPASRRLLYRLLRCLYRLPTAVGATDAFQIMYSLTPNILASQVEAEYDRSLSYRVVKFLVANFEDILEVPVDMQDQVFQHLKQPQQVTYCKQVSSQQFEQQRLTGSQLALSELLEQIIMDRKMGDKEKRRKIKLFRESYPHIYRRRFPELQGLRPSQEKSRGLLQFPSLGKLKNLRI